MINRPSYFPFLLPIYFYNIYHQSKLLRPFNAHKSQQRIISFFLMTHCVTNTTSVLSQVFHILHKCVKMQFFTEIYETILVFSIFANL